jgi:hypothetical protein
MQGVTAATPMASSTICIGNTSLDLLNAGVMGLAYCFDHYVITPDAVDGDNKQFNNKTERVK